MFTIIIFLVKLGCPKVRYAGAAVSSIKVKILQTTAKAVQRPSKRLVLQEHVLCPS
jgi:hypothetical protein